MEPKLQVVRKPQFAERRIIITMRGPLQPCVGQLILLEWQQTTSGIAQETAPSLRRRVHVSPSFDAVAPPSALTMFAASSRFC